MNKGSGVGVSMIEITAGLIGLVGVGIFLVHALDAYWAQ
jgi:hypothetical protein